MTQLMDPPATAGSNGNAQQAVAKRSFEPLAPIGNASALKSLLDAQRNGIAQALPKHITPERLIKTLLVAANRSPDILKCTQSSILETINRAAELGLDLSGTLGEAYPVPFNNRVKTADGDRWVMQLQLIIGYRGLEKLCWQSGEVEFIDAEVVRERDHFVFRKGTDVHVEWSPCLSGDRGEVVGAYACVKMKSGGKLARFLPKSDIEKIRESSKSKDSPAWRNWWDEMARKCALKRTLKDAPLSTEKFVGAMEQDETDYQLADVLAAETTAPRRGAVAVLGKLQQRQLPDTQPLDASDLASAELDAHFSGAGGGPETVPPAPIIPPRPSEEEAERVIQASAAKARAAASTWSVADDGLAQALDQPWEDVKRVLYDVAKAAGMTRARFEGQLSGWLLAKGMKGKEDKIRFEDRKDLYLAITEKRWDTGGKILAAAPVPAPAAVT